MNPFFLHSLPGGGEVSTGLRFHPHCRDITFFSKQRLNFIKMVNFLRSSFFVLSMFLMLGTGLWCILGVFIFPEKFAPYSTAIFTTAL